MSNDRIDQLHSALLFLKDEVRDDYVTSQTKHSETDDRLCAIEVRLAKLEELIARMRIGA